MLTTTKTTQFRGESKIGDAAAKIFEATINTTNPENLTLNSYVVNYDVYKSNRSAVAIDQASFEDAVYAFQESLIEQA